MISAPSPLVSLIIPTYNYGRFLADAIDSALAQTWPRLDIVVVDDGSTDDTSAIMAGYGAKVLSLRQEHAGVAAARNTGLRHSRGEFVCYLDADDSLAPLRVERQLAFFDALPERIGAVFTNALIYSDADPGRRTRLAHTQPPPIDDVLWRLLRHNYFFSATAMFRRSALEAIGEYDETLVTGEDYDFFLRLTRRFDVGYLDEALYICRKHPSSEMHRSLPEQQRSTLMRILHKQFDDPSLPPRARSIRATALANVHREIARQYLQRGQYRPAVAEMAQAAMLDPLALARPQRLMRFLRYAFPQLGSA